MSWLLLSTLVFAKSPAWVDKGAASVSISDTVEAPLLRGPATGFRPAVQATVQTHEDAEERNVLTIIDVAGGSSRISREMAAGLGLNTLTTTDKSGRGFHYAEIESLTINNLHISGLRVAVTKEPGFVLGVPSLGKVGVAVLPSEGVVRFVSSKASKKLVEAIGEPIEVTRGDGLTLQVPGELFWGPIAAPGTYHVRTDWSESRIAPSKKLPAPIDRGGKPSHSVGAGLGGVRLDNTWIVEDKNLTDPAPDFYAALGYDVLYAVDVAVDPAGRMAFRPAKTVKWTTAEPVAAQMATKRFELAEAQAERSGQETSAVREEQVRIGFEQTVKSDLGDPGHPLVRDRNLDLAQALWNAGEVDKAMPYYLTASQHAGDHCWTHLLLATRRLAWSGTMQEQSFVKELVKQPLQKADRLWQIWSNLSRTTRQAIIDGTSESAAIKLVQPEECGSAKTLQVLSLFRQGDVQGANEELPPLTTMGPESAYASGLIALENNNYAQASSMLERAQLSTGLPPMWLRLAKLRVLANTNHKSALRYVNELPGVETNSPLTAALIVWEASRSNPELEHLSFRLARADEQWFVAHLIANFAERKPAPAWSSRLDERQAGAASVLSLHAAQMALSGDVAGAEEALKSVRTKQIPDWWAATALIAYLKGDRQGVSEAIKELHLRFPLIPTTDLGLKI